MRGKDGLFTDTSLPIPGCGVIFAAPNACDFCPKLFLRITIHFAVVERLIVGPPGASCGAICEGECVERNGRVWKGCCARVWKSMSHRRVVERAGSGGMV